MREDPHVDRKVFVGCAFSNWTFQVNARIDRLGRLAIAIANNLHNNYSAATACLLRREDVAAMAGFDIRGASSGFNGTLIRFFFL